MPELLTILVVDDEPAVRRFVRTCLERNNYQVVEAGSAEEALAIYQQGGECQLVISDVRMPGLDGNELARRIYAQRPSQRILFVTAFPGSVADHVQSFDMLLKPFSATQLLRKVNGQMVNSAVA